MDELMYSPDLVTPAKVGPEEQTVPHSGRAVARVGPHPKGIGTHDFPIVVTPIGSP